MSTADTVVEPVALRAVVCDDDPMIRSVVARVAAVAGVEVVAEADSADDALDLLLRTGADELILDLSLAHGRGEDALARVRSQHLRCRTTVFSAFVDDPDRLLAAGASDIVAKPDFERLEAVLAEHVATQAPADGDRRRGRISRTMPTPRFLSPSGLAPPADVQRMADSLVSGDAVLALRIEGFHALGQQHGSIVAADHVLEAARLTRDTLRIQDRVGVDEQGTVLALILGGGNGAAESVYRRVHRAWVDSGASGSLRGGYVVVSGALNGRSAPVAAVAAVGTAAATGQELVAG